MDEHGRLREAFGAQERLRARDRRALGVGERELQVSREEPLGHEVHLAIEHGGIVGREMRGAGLPVHLDAQQAVERRAVQRVGVAARVELRQVVRVAQVLEQHETALAIHRVHRRHVHVARREQGRDFQVGPDVLLVRRRVHDDAAAAAVRRSTLRHRK